jgi:hypothetical protein
MTEDESIEAVAEELAEEMMASEDVTPFIAWKLQNETLQTLAAMYAKLHDSGVDPESTIQKSIEHIFVSVAEDWRPRNVGIKASFAALTVEETAENADDHKEA